MRITSLEKTIEQTTLLVELDAIVTLQTTKREWSNMSLEIGEERPYSSMSLAIGEEWP